MLINSRNLILDKRKELATLCVRPVIVQRLLRRIREESLFNLFSSI
jgi:hypothetical protein